MPESTSIFVEEETDAISVYVSEDTESVAVFVEEVVGGVSSRPVKLCSAIRGENISGARAVYLVVESGTVKCYLASSSSQEAHGFVREAGSTGSPVDVWEAAPLTGLSGITPGQSYWLGASGQFAAAPPNGASVIQRLGRGVSTTELFGRIHPASEVI